MKESYGEGVATHTGPESCVGFPRGGGEALTGVHAGRVLSREIILNFRVPTLWDRWKATPDVSPARDTAGPCAVGGHEHACKTPRTGTGRAHLRLRNEGFGGRSGKSKDVNR